MPVNTKEQKAAKRKIYERERKNRKRVEAYSRLREPERSRKLATNALRRSYKMRHKKYDDSGRLL